MQLRNEEMRIVARVAHKCETLLLAREIPSGGIGASDQELVRIIAIIQIGLTNGASAVEALQVEPRGAVVPNLIEVFAVLKNSAVVRDVVSDELAKKCPPCGVPGSKPRAAATRAYL